MTAKIAGRPTSAELAAELGHVKTALNLFFLIFGGALVFFMQAGFAMVETGFCRSKNAVHVIMTNFVIFAIGVVSYCHRDGIWCVPTLTMARHWGRRVIPNARSIRLRKAGRFSPGRGMPRAHAWPWTRWIGASFAGTMH